MNAKIDLTAEVPGLGVCIHDVRLLACEALSALGVNMRADGGSPTVQTVYSHALTELIVEMGLLHDALDKENDPVAVYIRRFSDRLSLLNECAAILSKLHASSRNGGAP